MTELRVALVLLWRNGRLCVTQRRADASHLPDVWEFPGGKVEAGESPREACVREAREELGVNVRIVGEREPLRFEYPERRVTLFPFDCALQEGSQNGEPQALSAQSLRWLSPSQLRDEEFPPANAPLLAALRASPLMNEHAPETELIHRGETPAENAKPVFRPIYTATTFEFDSASQLRAFNDGQGDGYIYTRYANPTIESAEEKLAAIEGGERALLFSSGQAATSALLFGLLQSGDEIACASNVYGGTFRLMRDLLPRFGVRVKWLAPDGLTSVEALRGCKLLWFETPSNPTLRVVSLSQVARACREVGALSVCDNTFANPMVQRPLSHGIDLAMHSATKSLNGHSDVTAGALVGRGELLRDLAKTRLLLGGTLDPQAAYALSRGLKTLHVRTQRSNESALVLAQRLEESGLCERAFYPGLASHPDFQVAREQMNGFGAIVTVDVGSQERAEAAFDKLKLFARAASLGGVESLCSLPVLTSHYGLSDDELRASGVTRGMMRLSVGLEGVDDLWRDLQQALS